MPTILIVDDDALVRETIAVSLAERGFSVLTASHGREALAILGRVGRVDSIVLDILMPEMEGIEVLLQIRKRSAHLPVIVISGGTRDGWIDALGMAAKLGADRTLMKPFTPQQLVDALYAVLPTTRRD